MQDTKPQWFRVGSVKSMVSGRSSFQFQNSNELRCAQIKIGDGPVSS